jgi:hypothetical protein
MLISARSFSGNGRQRRLQDVQFSSVGGSSRQVGRFEQSVASIAPWAGSSGDQADPIDAGAMSPGQRNTAKTYRQRSKEDVSIPLLANLVSSGLIGASALFISVTLRLADWTIRPFWLHRCQWWIGRHWYVITPAAFLATMAGLWFKRQLPDLLDDDKLIVSVQEQERRPEPTPIEVKPPSVNLEINERNDHGRIAHQDRVELYSPKANAQGLALYCAALAKKQAFPSWEGGQSGLGAKAFGYTENEFSTWRASATTARLLVKRKGQNQGYAVTERGLVAFERIGRQQLRVASYGI